MQRVCGPDRWFTPAGPLLFQNKVRQRASHGILGSHWLRSLIQDPRDPLPFDGNETAQYRHGELTVVTILMSVFILCEFSVLHAP